MTAYAIALINISDRQKYAQYEQGFMGVFSKYQGKLLSVDESPTVKEGNWPYTRTVLIEFPNGDALDAWYHSAEYQTLAKHRFSAAEASIAVVIGLPARTA